jgi:hypothetical protein
VKLLHFGDVGRFLHLSNLNCSIEDVTPGLLPLGFVQLGIFASWHKVYDVGIALSNLYIYLIHYLYERKFIFSRVDYVMRIAASRRVERFKVKHN